MKVICINNVEIIKNDNPYIGTYPKEYNLTIGSSYNVKSIHDRGSSGEVTFYIKELHQFVPGELFVNVQQWRDEQLEKLLND